MNSKRGNREYRNRRENTTGGYNESIYSNTYGLWASCRHWHDTCPCKHHQSPFTQHTQVVIRACHPNSLASCLNTCRTTRSGDSHDVVLHTAPGPPAYAPPSNPLGFYQLCAQHCLSARNYFSFNPVCLPLEAPIFRRSLPSVDACFLNYAALVDSSSYCGVEKGINGVGPFSRPH